MRSKKVQESIEIFKSWIDFNKNNKNIVNKADELIEVQENILDYIKELENARSPYFIPKAIIRVEIEEYKRKILELHKKDLWVEPDYTILRLKYQYYIEALEKIEGGYSDDK